MKKRYRQSQRRPGHDYSSAGSYLVTVCVRNRDPLLGAVNGEEVVLSALGLIVQQEWTDIPKRFPMVRLDELTIMPNHMHGIITIVGAPVASRCASCCPLGQPVTLRVAAGARPVDQPDWVDPGNSKATHSGLSTVRAGTSPRPTLGAIIGAFKSLSDRRCRETVIAEEPQRRFGHLWQRNYHDHIIRNDRELVQIRQYILGNPADWESDENHPERQGITTSGC